MAQKIAQISKDFNMKTKDVVDLFGELDIKKNTSGTVENDELNLFISKLTLTHSMKNIEDYLGGKIKISVIEEKKAPKKAEAPKAEEPKIEVKADEKKAEIKKPEAPRPRETTRPEEKKFASSAKVNTATEYHNTSYKRDEKPRRPEKPQYQRYNERPQENPFAKKHDSMNRAADGFRQAAPKSQIKPNAAEKVEIKETVVAKPLAQGDANTLRPAQKMQLEKREKQQMNKLLRVYIMLALNY